MTPLTYFSISAVTWLLVMIGWTIVNYQNNLRENRKDKRNLIDSTIKLIESITTQAIVFHTNSTFDDKASKDLFYSISRLSRSIYRYDLTSSTPIPFRRAITLKNFGKSEFEPKDYNSDFVTEIFETKEALIDSIEGTYFQEFHMNTSPWWQFWKEKKIKL